MCVQPTAEGGNRDDGCVVVDYREFDPERRALLDAEGLRAVSPSYATDESCRPPVVAVDDSLALARDKCASRYLSYSLLTVISLLIKVIIIEKARAAVFSQVAVHVAARLGRLRAGGAGHGDRPAHAARPHHHCRRQTRQAYAPTAYTQTIACCTRTIRWTSALQRAAISSTSISCVRSSQS